MELAREELPISRTKAVSETTGKVKSGSLSPGLGVV